MKPSIILPAVLLLACSTSGDHGVKTVRHAYSASASGSNSFASSFASGGAGTSIKAGAGGFAGAGNDPFWWAGPNSPFKEAHDYVARCSQKGECGNLPGPFAGIPANVPAVPQNGCNGNGCSFSGSYNVHDKQQAGSVAGDIGGPVDRSKNPFLNGEFQGVAISSCSGNACPGGKPHSTITTTQCKGADCKTNTQHGAAPDLSQNPFLNGAFAEAGGFGGASGCSGVKGGCSGAPQGSNTFQYGYQGQTGGCSGGANCGGQPGGQGCGPAGCSNPSGSYGGSGSFAGSGSQGQPGYSGQSTYTDNRFTGSTSGSFAGSGSGSTPPLIGGCAGTRDGCKPGQPGYSGQNTFTGSTTGSGNFAGSQPGSEITPPLIGGCAGTRNGCKPGQPGYSGQTSFTGSTTGSGSFAGSQSGSGSISGSTPPLIGGCAGTRDGCKPGQPGYSGQTSFTGSTTGSGSFAGSQPGSGITPPLIGGCAGTRDGCKPGQPGYSGQPTYTDNRFTGSTSGSFAGSQGQPGYGQPGEGFPGQSGSTPGSYSGQHTQTTGQSGSGSYSGSSTLTGGSQTSFTQSIPTTHPGQSGQPGQPGYSGFPGAFQPGQSTPGSFSGSASGSYGTSGFTSGSQHTQTTANQPGYSGSHNTPSGGYAGSTSGSFGGSGSGSFAGKTTPAGGDELVKCYGEGLTCVKKHLCNNGVVNNNGDGLLQVRDGDHYCDAATETCCKLPGKSGRPYDETPVALPGFPGGSTTFQSTKSHQASSASASSSSSGSSSFGSTTYFGSQGTSPSDIGSRFTPGPTAGGVQPGYSPNLPGQVQVPSGGYQPGQSIPFGGSDGQSPGVIQVIPDGQSGKTSAPGLVRPTGLQHFGPGQAPGLRTTPGLQEYGPGQAPGLRTTPGVDVRPHGQSPGLFDATPSGTENDINFASTLKGPAYLPPGPSPSPSPSSYSPDLLPPSRPSTPAPTNYYPTQKTTPAYLPPYSGSQTTSRFVPTTRKPQAANGYLPPQEPSATVGDNQYLPPPKDNNPDSDIIRVSVIPPVTPPRNPPYYPDRDPDGTNGDPSVLRPPTSPRPRPTQNPRTDYPQNTTPYPGCAAALKCVSGEFCTAEGVISKVRVLLTPEQEINRVPLTECYDPESGIIGKCCRDPEYKDPWPSTQLGLFNPDQDFQGSNPQPGRFPDGKYRPKPQPGVKGRPQGGIRPINPYEPNQIGSPSNNPNAVIRPGGYPSDVPNIPFDSRLVNVPQQVDFRPPVENRFDNKFPTSPVKNPDTCGVRHPDGNPRGPGPIDASFAEIPWQAMILRDTNRSLLCGGAIIRRDVVLTAAHCVENLKAEDVLVKGGEWKLGIDEEPKPFQINKVAAIVRHPGYRPENRFNDVALLYLTDKFRTDRNVDTLCLPDPGEDVAQKFQNSKCITTGWGKTILQLHIQNSIMHILGVGIIQGSQCQQQLQQYHQDSAHLYNTNCVCGAPVQPQADICDVDIGSALACEGPDGRYTLAGIYSWDTGCNPTAQVAGYTRVDTHWVQQTLQRPIKDLKTEESGFYQQLAGQECHCLPGKK